MFFMNLLNELGKRDKMRGLPSSLSLFRNEFIVRGDRDSRAILMPIYGDLYQIKL